MKIACCECNQEVDCGALVLLPEGLVCDSCFEKRKRARANPYRRFTSGEVAKKQAAIHGHKPKAPLARQQSDIPDGYRYVSATCYTDGDVLVVCADPAELWPDDDGTHHRCDAMGCGWEHVVAIVGLHTAASSEPVKVAGSWIDCETENHLHCITCSICKGAIAQVSRQPPIREWYWEAVGESGFMPTLDMAKSAAATALRGAGWTFEEKGEPHA